MKRTILFAVCAMAATAAAAQWHYLSGGKLSGISSVGSYVWAVGQDGLFFFSVDNGESWRRMPRFTTRSLVDVEFWDKSFGLVTQKATSSIVRLTTALHGIPVTFNILVVTSDSSRASASGL